MRTFRDKTGVCREIRDLNRQHGGVLTAGHRARVVVLDELSFYRSSENLPIDREMLRVVRPSLATTGGKLVIFVQPLRS